MALQRIQEGQGLIGGHEQPRYLDLMKPSAIACSTNTFRESKNPSTFSMPIGLRWMPNCAQATTSNSSSSVPKPPAKRQRRLTATP